MQAEDWHGILAPDASYEDEPGGWEVIHAILMDAAASHPWQNRTSQLMFRGAPTGKRAEMLGPDLGALR